MKLTCSVTVVLIRSAYAVSAFAFILFRRYIIYDNGERIKVDKCNEMEHNIFISCKGHLAGLNNPGQLTILTMDTLEWSCEDS